MLTTASRDWRRRCLAKMSQLERDLLSGSRVPEPVSLTAVLCCKCAPILCIWQFWTFSCLDSTAWGCCHCSGGTFALLFADRWFPPQNADSPASNTLRIILCTTLVLTIAVLLGGLKPAWVPLWSFGFPLLKVLGREASVICDQESQVILKPCFCLASSLFRLLQLMSVSASK